MSIAIASLIISFLVACAVIYREFLHEWLFRPNLQVEFSLNEPISRETLLVNNIGRRAAQRCEGVLAEVRRPDSTLDERYDPLIFRWRRGDDRQNFPVDVFSGCLASGLPAEFRGKTLGTYIGSGGTSVPSDGHRNYVPHAQ
jgi:hypothetical protein